jgi:hypothetical protein
MDSQQLQSWFAQRTEAVSTCLYPHLRASRVEAYAVSSFNCHVPKPTAHQQQAHDKNTDAHPSKGMHEQLDVRIESYRASRTQDKIESLSTRNMVTRTIDLANGNGNFIISSTG